jgi:threonine dehydrogenase-like Zn-dependent dehydrogenase
MVTTALSQDVRRERGERVRVMSFAGPGQMIWDERVLATDASALELEVAGICGTDRHIYAGRIEAPEDSVLGHELVGRVASIAPDAPLVADWEVRVGDRVVVAPGIDCGTCANCSRLGTYCENRRLYGLNIRSRGITGGFAPKMQLLPGTHVFRLPDRLPPLRAVFVEIVACTVRALKRALPEGEVLAQSSVQVLGFGPVGLAAATVALSEGAHVTVAEPAEPRRRLAEALGFTTIDPHVDTGTADVVVECAGNPEAFAQAIELVRTGGTVVEMGNAADLGPVALRPSAICLRDLRVIGSSVTRYEDFPVAIRIVAETPVDLEAAITRVFRFDDVRDPNELFHESGGLKAAILFDGGDRDG